MTEQILHNHILVFYFRLGCCLWESATGQVLREHISLFQEFISRQLAYYPACRTSS